MVLQLLVDPTASNLFFWMMLICSEPKCIITLYKNGYKMEDKEFCKKNDTKEHERFYASLIEGLGFIVISYVIDTFLMI